MFNFSLESQVLYHAPLSFEPIYTDIPPESRPLPGMIEAAVNQARHGDAGAEEVGEILVHDDQRDKAYMIGEEEMKVFVNSEKWSLGMPPLDYTVSRRLAYWQLKSI